MSTGVIMQNDSSASIKKQTLVNILEKLMPYWDLAIGIHAVIVSQDITEKQLDIFLSLIEEGITEVKQERVQEKMRMIIMQLKKIYTRETREQLREFKELEELLKRLKGIL